MLNRAIFVGKLVSLKDNLLTINTAKDEPNHVECIISDTLVQMVQPYAIQGTIIGIKAYIKDNKVYVDKLTLLQGGKHD